MFPANVAGKRLGGCSVQFGIQYFPVRGEADSASEYFAESIDLAVEAERQGFMHARIVEHYFHRYGGFSPNPLIMLAAIAQRTKSLRLVTGAVLPVFNNPLKLAGEIGMVDAISNGRLDVGFARAFLPHEFRRFGISADESHDRYREGIEQIELLLTKERVTHKGRFHSFEDITSLPRPTQKPRPKFYVAATQSPETFEFAGRMGYSLMAIPIGPIRPLLELYRKSWREAGNLGNGEVMVAFHMFCHEDDATARDLSRNAFVDYFDALNECAGDWIDVPESKDYRGYQDTVRKLKTVNLDQQIEGGGAWIGSPERIIAAIKRCQAAIGPFEHASLQVNFGGISYKEASASLSLFAKEVMPNI